MAHIRIDTYGWDTQYVTTFQKINQAIANNQVTPPSFSATENDPATGRVTYSLQGTWGTWALSLDRGGGGGQLLVLKCPVTSGHSIHYQYDASGQQSVLSDLDISGGNVWIQLQLVWVESALTIQDPTAEPNTGTQQQLVVAAPPAGASSGSGPSSGNGSSTAPVSVLGSDFQNLSSCAAIANPLEKTAAPSIAESMIGQWINANLGQFKQVFAELLVNEIAAEGDWQWIKPTTVDYAVAADTQTQDLSKSIFAVNCMVNQRPSVRTYNQVDQRILSLMTNSDSVFVISPQMFVQYVLLKGCLAMYLGSSEEDWVFDNDDLGISNKNAMNIGKMPCSGGATAQASVTKGNLHLQIRDEDIFLEINNMAWAWDSGNNVTASYQAYFKPVLKSGTDSTGKPYVNVLDVVQDGDETLTVGVDKTAEQIQSDIWKDIVSGAVGGLLGAGVGAVVEKGLDALATRAAAGPAAQPLLMQLPMRQFARVLARAVGRGTDQATLDTLTNALAAADRLAQRDAAQNVARVAGPGGQAFAQSLRTGATDLLKYVFTNKWQLIGGLLGAFAGESLGKVGEFTDAKIEDQLSQLPTIDTLLSQCLSGVRWPDQKPGTEGFQIQQVLLEDALLLGGTLVTAKSA